MAITVKCSSCKSKYQVRDTLAGQSIVCKECGESIAVPASFSVSAGAAPAKGYAVKGAGGKTARPVSPQKLSSETAARVLSRGIEAPKSIAPHESNSARENSSSRKPEVAIVTDLDAWEVKVDPPDETFEIDSKKRIVATFPRNSTEDVVYPECPSPFVALGSNKN